MKQGYQLLILVLAMTATYSGLAQVEVHYDRGDERAYYNHMVQPKQTLYAISKTYGCDVAAIMSANQLKSPALSLGQRLVIPFINEALLYDIPPNKSEEYAPVFYEVRRKETAFRISRKYFKVNLTAIKDLNKLEKNSLAIGQLLIIGYLKKYMPAALIDLEDVKEDVIVESIKTLPPAEVESTVETIKPDPIDVFDERLYTVSHENGAAFWDKHAAGLRGYYVLHRYAQRNTWIEVTNPMYNMSVRAKVIGNIPDGSYPDDVLVVVSPSIAKDLGAIDARFYVKVRYLRAETKMTKGK